MFINRHVNGRSQKKTQKNRENTQNLPGDCKLYRPKPGISLTLYRMNERIAANNAGEKKKTSHHLIFCDARVHTPFHSKRAHTTHTHTLLIYIRVYIFEPFTVCFVWCEQHEFVVRVYWRKHVMPHQRALLLLEIHSHRMNRNNLWCTLCDIPSTHWCVLVCRFFVAVMFHCSLVLTSTHMLIDCCKAYKGQWPECAHSLSILLDNG